jgi:hypothetical protein
MTKFHPKVHPVEALFVPNLSKNTLAKIKKFTGHEPKVFDGVIYIHFEDGDKYVIFSQKERYIIKKGNVFYDMTYRDFHERYERCHDECYH